MKTIKKIMLIIVGSISLSLGITGIFLPILPTTPFLLLSCYCYLNSSERLYKWIINHRVFGEYIYNYLTYRAVRRKAKIRTFVFLWSALIISMLLVSGAALKLFLFAVGIGVSIHIFTLKTLTDEMITDSTSTRSFENSCSCNHDTIGEHADKDKTIIESEIASCAKSDMQQK